MGSLLWVCLYPSCQAQHFNEIPCPGFQNTPRDSSFFKPLLMVAHGEFLTRCLIPTAEKKSDAQDLQTLKCFKQVCILLECHSEGHSLGKHLWFFYPMVEWSQDRWRSVCSWTSPFLAAVQVCQPPWARGELGCRTCIPRGARAPGRHQGRWE